MIFLNEIKTEPLFMNSENIEKYKMHKSGFGTVIFDKNGFKHHVRESLEEAQEIVARGSNIKIKIPNYEIGIGKPVSPRTIQIKLPKNVPSKVKPIVIFPDEDYDRVTVHVSQFDRYGTYKSIDAEIKDNQAHVINLNAGVE